MAKSQTPFAEMPESSKPPIPVDWRWIEQPPARGELAPAPPRPKGYDEIPAGTFRGAGGEWA